MTDKRLSGAELERHIAVIGSYFIPQNDGFESVSRVAKHIAALEAALAKAEGEAAAEQAAWLAQNKRTGELACDQFKLEKQYAAMRVERDSARALVEKFRSSLMGFVEYFEAIQDGEYPVKRPELRTFEQLLLDKGRKALSASRDEVKA